MQNPGDPLGVVLAGGAARRLGGAKATADLAGRPLIAYPLDALAQALGSVAVVAKRDSPLPALSGTPVWIEPDEPRHPLTGIVHALLEAQGRDVLVCAVDLPLVSAALIGQLARTPAQGALALLARTAGQPQPTLGRYSAAALGPLATALDQPGRPLVEVVSEIEAQWLEVADGQALFNVNTREDLSRAGAILDQRAPAQPNVKS